MWLKAAKGRLTEDQWAWMVELGLDEPPDGAVRTRTWYPADIDAAFLLRG